MALTARLSNTPAVSDRLANYRLGAVCCSVPYSRQHNFHPTIQGIDLRQQSSGHYVEGRMSPSGHSLWCLYESPVRYVISWGPSVLCSASRTHRTGSKEAVTHSGHSSDLSRNCYEKRENDHQVAPQKAIYSQQGLAEACKYVQNDAKFVNERARSDIILLSRGILSLEARARQDVAILSSEFLKLDARAREDTERFDHNVKKKAERLHHITRFFKQKAKSRLKSVADKHWNDGALEADLRRAEFRAKQRAMEDTLMALEFLKNIHDMMVSNVYSLKKGLPSTNVTLEKNGKNLDFFLTDVSDDRIAAIQEAYWSMASALSEADGIDYTDPEELELLITTLIDLDAMDSKSSVTLLAECSSSSDVNTRRALANALAAAPSMWTLGNAGMGALQRLAEDGNPAVASPASRAIHELKKEWEIEEGDNWRFMINHENMEAADAIEDDDQDAIN
ncbi:hypothetical protein Nepgr_028140 [Nepenthes gracilis]|uniref:Senescence-associated protein SPA15, chloroplastic n=1 Tax=Nepenthes gracilis TaxID=150966 RepID=A0AAD3TD38_NEPGR|nr:hypothetical protein Nepgr_028140 [Nepenthes gracilis]